MRVFCRFPPPLQAEEGLSPVDKEEGGNGGCAGYRVLPAKPHTLGDKKLTHASEAAGLEVEQKGLKDIEFHPPCRRTKLYIRFPEYFM